MITRSSITRKADEMVRNEADRFVARFRKTGEPLLFGENPDDGRKAAMVGFGAEPTFRIFFTDFVAALER